MHIAQFKPWMEAISLMLLKHLIALRWSSWTRLLHGTPRCGFSLLRRSSVGGGGLRRPRLALSLEFTWVSCTATRCNLLLLHGTTTCALRVGWLALLCSLLLLLVLLMTSVVRLSAAALGGGLLGLLSGIHIISFVIALLRNLFKVYFGY